MYCNLVNASIITSLLHVFNEKITGTNYNHLSRMYNGRKQQEYNEFLMDIRNRDAPLKENIDAEDLHIFQ